MRFLVADDHPLYREAVVTQIRRLYPEARVDECAALDDALAAARTDDAEYDLFLLDFHMPGVSEASVASLLAEFPETPLAIVSGTADVNDIRATIKAGARGFIPKTASAGHFAHAVQLLLAGGTSIPAEALIEPANSPAGPASAHWLALLTPRELEVLSAVAKGISNKEIGRELSLAEVTVKLHLRSIFRKMGARSRAEAAVIATKSGIA